MLEAVCESSLFVAAFVLTREFSRRSWPDRVTSVGLSAALADEQWLLHRSKRRERLSTLAKLLGSSMSQRRLQRADDDFLLLVGQRRKHR